ncbi:Na(+)/citrate cotransporter-like isoform X4 [Dermacentor albipictus]|uniref:Na(+)/citrate cotransporter-like isoform X4 n=1 Tax=Dermacentor albipictus TaxID=60249 RepID=UPI0031FDFE1B
MTLRLDCHAEFRLRGNGQQTICCPVRNRHAFMSRVSQGVRGLEAVVHIRGALAASTAAYIHGKQGWPQRLRHDLDGGLLDARADPAGGHGAHAPGAVPDVRRPEQRQDDHPVLQYTLFGPETGPAEHGEVSSADATALQPPNDVRAGKMRRAMLLAVAYAANIGGTGSLIGTPPNLILQAEYAKLFGQDDVTFLSWMAYNVPPMLLCTMLAWMYVQWKVAKLTPMGAEEAIRERVKLELLRRYHQLGPMTFHQAAVLALTTFMIFLWLTQNPRVIPGWSNLFPYGKQILSSVPAVLVSILLFVVPKDPRQGLRSKGLLTWEEASVKIHWGTIFIICGGMTLAEASKDSGLSAMLVLQMRGLNVMPSYLVVGVLCFSASMLTEVTSNTAITAIMLPIIFEMAVALEVHPLYFAIPVVVACSFSFMLPAATPPNAIVYEMGNFRIVDMAAPGFVMNMVCVVVELVAIHTLGPLVFGLRSLPEGAAATDKNATVARALTERAVQSAR